MELYASFSRHTLTEKKDFQALFQLFAPFQLLKNRAYDQLGETRISKEIFNVNTFFVNIDN